MIISKTPYRISFFGGGSDYPSWYQKHGGCVISTTINKYIYISCRELPPYFNHKNRIVYSKIETTKNINDIKHAVIKNVLKSFRKEFFFKKSGLEIHYDGDLPSRTGVGSSSAFVVGFLNLLNIFFNKKLSKNELIDQSIYLEQKILKEVVGSQDQIATCYGGFNEIVFFQNGKYQVNPLIKNYKDLANLEDQLFLVFSGIRVNTGNDIASTYVSSLDKKNKNLIFEIINHANIAKRIIKNKNFLDFGLLLNETWKIKRSLSKSISNSKVDTIYELGLKNGATGGKLLGAGGAGFVLFFVPKNNKSRFLKAFKNFIIVNFKFENKGTHIILNDRKI
jgi:D-glycero-alpha-D-manno-heptose-7-phosphate kinase